MAECKDCLQIKAIEGKVDRAVKENADYEKRITKLERKSDVNDERFDRVFAKLDEIIDALKVKSQRLPNLLYTVSGIVIGGVLVWLITKSV